MTLLNTIYKSVKTYSDILIKHGDEWKREMASAKNYIATPNLKHWTFGKSVGADGDYHTDGGAAKQRLYSLGFVDVLRLKDKDSKQVILDAFFLWAQKVKQFDIIEKFERDQRGIQRFELLVHNSLLDETDKIRKKLKSNQDFFDEGFKKEIVKEIAYRNKKIVSLAKEQHGTNCVVCKFDFGKFYGSYGEGFVEMHHLYPMSEGKRKTSIDELQPVCANCHRMLHRGKELLTIEELKEIIKKNLINKL